jgi:type VI secretion system protein ImpH
MATTSRSEDLDVSRSFLGKELRAHPGRFNFFQVVRVLQRLYLDRVPVGLLGPPEREAMRFAAHNTLVFPQSQIYEIQWDVGGQPKIVVNFMGLTGPMGVLPFSFTELVRDRARAKDRTTQDFFDLFNHRLISLFYQAWEKYRFFVAYERDRKDRFSKYLMSFVGLGTQGLQTRQRVRDESFLYYCGLLSLQARSAAALEQLVSDYFGITAEVEQFVGAWHAISAADQCCFEAGNEYSEQLGAGAIAGDEIWDHQSRACLKLGPLDIEQYLDFLPTGRAAEPLQTLLHFFSGREIEFEVQLILKRDDVPVCELGKDLQAKPFLGWTTWMKSSPSFDRNPADAILLLN